MKKSYYAVICGAVPQIMYPVSVWFSPEYPKDTRKPCFITGTGLRHHKKNGADYFTVMLGWGTSITPLDFLESRRVHIPVETNIQDARKWLIQALDWYESNHIECMRPELVRLEYEPHRRIYVIAEYINSPFDD